MNILVLEGGVDRDRDSILGRMFLDLFLGRWKRHWILYLPTDVLIIYSHVMDDVMLLLLLLLVLTSILILPPLPWDCPGGVWP